MTAARAACWAFGHRLDTPIPVFVPPHKGLHCPRCGVFVRGAKPKGFLASLKRRMEQR